MPVLPPPAEGLVNAAHKTEGCEPASGFIDASLVSIVRGPHTAEDQVRNSILMQEVGQPVHRLLPAVFLFIVGKPRPAGMVLQQVFELMAWDTVHAFCLPLLISYHERSLPCVYR